MFDAIIKHVQALRMKENYIMMIIRKFLKVRNGLTVFVLGLLFVFSSAVQAQVDVSKKQISFDVRTGPPVINAVIKGQTYRFLVSPSATNTIWLSPNVVDALNLKMPKSTPVHKRVPMSLDHHRLLSKTQKVSIAFEGMKKTVYNVHWLSSAPYLGYDGYVGPAVFKKDVTTFILNDVPADVDLKEDRFDLVHRDYWRTRYGEGQEVAIRLHYDETRLTIGEAYSVEDRKNLEFAGSPFLRPREFRNHQEFVAVRFKSPIMPLGQPEETAIAHILFGSRGKVETVPNEIVVKGVKKRNYTNVTWLGRDYFQDCSKIVFHRKKQKLVTHCAK